MERYLAKSPQAVDNAGVMHPLETYLRELRYIRATGAGVPETSYYGPLANLLNEIGKGLKPKVRCVINLANRGAGIPDGGLFTPDQIKKDDPNPMQGQAPSRGVIEVKSTADDVATITAGEQVSRYCNKYGLVLVTNYRDFTLVARAGVGVPPAILESYRLAGSEQEFWAAAAHPRKFAQQNGEIVRFGRIAKPAAADSSAGTCDCPRYREEC